MLPPLTRSAKLYQERRMGKTRPTWRRPGPRLAIDSNEGHRFGLSPPFPLADATRSLADRPPDADTTLPWLWREESV